VGTSRDGCMEDKRYVYNDNGKGNGEVVLVLN
jgi:hypothetical protein